MADFQVQESERVRLVAEVIRTASMSLDEWIAYLMGCCVGFAVGLSAWWVVPFAALFIARIVAELRRAA